MAKEYLEYNDLLLVPKYSDMRSRSEISLECEFRGIELGTPIFVAPMDSISTLDFIKQISEAGGLAFIHRFQTDQERLDQIQALSGETFGVSVGLLDEEDGEWLIVRSALEHGVPIICIDVANGHNKYTLNSVEYLANEIKRHDYSTKIMAGNIASIDGFNKLDAVGCDFIRVGIGSGSACTTRNMTGVGVPQATLLEDLNKLRLPHSFYDKNFPIIVADGGIKYPGDIIKALALGADAVMTGYLFSGAKEAGNGVYRGMASKSAQEDRFGFVRSIEGIEIDSLNHGESVSEIMKRINDNLKSGMSYLGAYTLGEIIGNTEFIQVKKGSIKEI